LNYYAYFHNPRGFNANRASNLLTLSVYCAGMSMQRLHRKVDIGVVASPECMAGKPRLAGRRLTMRFLKRLSRQEMRSIFQLTAQEIETVIRYWSVRGFTKVR
jgi:hypothetical protein